MDLQAKNIATKQWIKSQELIQKIIEDSISEYAKKKSFDSIPENLKIKMRKEIIGWAESIGLSNSQAESFSLDCPTLYDMISSGSEFKLLLPPKFSDEWWFEVGERANDKAVRNFKELEESNVPQGMYEEEYKLNVERYNDIHAYCFERISKDFWDDLPF